MSDKGMDRMARATWDWASQRAYKLIEDCAVKYGSGPNTDAAATVAAAVLMHAVASHSGPEGFMAAMNASLKTLAKKSDVQIAVMAKRKGHERGGIWAPSPSRFGL